MNRTQKIMLLAALLFVLVSAAFFATNLYADNAGSDKVIPPGICHIHGENVERIVIDNRLVCLLCQ